MTDDRQSVKAEIRRAALAKRDALTTEERAAAAAALTDAADLIGDVCGKVVSGFWPIRSEIDPRPLMARLCERGAVLALPVTVDDRKLEFRRWQAGQELHKAGFGLMEPGDEAKVVDPEIMLVPLAAFDQGFDRIGYGAGYYDREIARLAAAGRKPRLIGLAYNCQKVGHVPTEPHDQPLDLMITETGAIGKNSEMSQ